jgi:hypothetical protein
MTAVGLLVRAKFALKRLADTVVVIAEFRSSVGKSKCHAVPAQSPMRRGIFRVRIRTRSGKVEAATLTKWNKCPSNGHKSSSLLEASFS